MYFIGLRHNLWLRNAWNDLKIYQELEHILGKGQIVSALSLALSPCSLLLTTAGHIPANGVFLP